MGLLDDLKGKLNEVLGEGTVNGLMDHAMKMLNDPATGGLPGLIETFKSKGLGEVISSWISTGKNMPITAEQIQQVLGPQRMEQIAQKLGISAPELAQQLTTYLPQIIDKLTPNGQLPNASVLEDGISILKKSLMK